MADRDFETPKSALAQDLRPAAYIALVPVVLALVMAAPSLRGDFLSGDDVQLVRDHVLVNRPSFEHLVKLFAVPHRDLYQPIPLATFALNFAMIRGLGLEPWATGPSAGAWVFHLTNVLIHALNAYLVWALIRRLTGCQATALAAASLFAVHPLNVECVAWLSGRIMMLSATFTLVSLIAAHRAFHRPTAATILLTLLTAVLTMMSKVNVGLPLLLLVIPLLERRAPARPWWGLVVLVGVVTGLFALLNVHFSRGELALGAAALEGPRWVRVGIALAWYLTRYFVPIGLSPWHPTEAVVAASDPGFVPALIVCVAFLVAAVLLASRSSTGRAGLLWFLCAIAAALPLVPSRNLLVAERYAYLPAIGLHWIVAAGSVLSLRALRRGGAGRAVRPIGAGVFAVLVVSMISLSWRTTGDYRDNVARCRRIAQLYPQHSEVWTNLAWAYYGAGRYQEAVEAASVELAQTAQESSSEARQARGMALLRARAIPEALAELEAAVQGEPANGMAHARLAAALAEAGRINEAVRHYVRAVDLLPNYNPAIIGLAHVYRTLDRPQEAAELFARALANNSYDPIAAAALAEIELTAGEIDQARRRLERLLSWAPEDAAARSNLALCYLHKGRKEDAVREYRRALDFNPELVFAQLNLALLLAQIGDPQEADLHFRLAAHFSRHADPAVLLPYSDFLVEQDRLRDAAEVWSRGVESGRRDKTMACWYAWVCALAERWDLARQFLSGGPGKAAPLPATLTSILLDVHARRPESVTAAVEALCADDSSEGPEARGRLQRALEGYADRHPDNPWPHFVRLSLLHAEGRVQDAHATLATFAELCQDAEWVERARALLEAHPAEPAPSGR